MSALPYSDYRVCTPAIWNGKGLVVVNAVRKTAWVGWQHSPASTKARPKREGHKHIDKRSKTHSEITIGTNVPWMPCTWRDGKWPKERGTMKEIAFLVDNACALDRFPRCVRPILAIVVPNRASSLFFQPSTTSFLEFSPSVALPKTFSEFILSTQAVIGDVRRKMCSQAMPRPAGTFNPLVRNDTDSARASVSTSSLITEVVHRVRSMHRPRQNPVYKVTISRC